MLIIPAIDIIEGRVVRLRQGDFKKEKFYSDEPLEQALKWSKSGAQFLHIVDLDGARTGRVKNIDIITRIIKAVSIPCEVGGGLGDSADMEYFIKKGAKRVVLGTRAFEDIEYLEKLVFRFNEKIAVSIDFSGDKVVKRGWQEKTDLEPVELAKKMQLVGVKTLIVTDVALDGTLAGIKIDMLKKILDAVDINVVASGGVSSLEDIKKLIKINNKNLEGAIIGRALYEGKIDLKEAIKIAQ